MEKLFDDDEKKPTLIDRIRLWWTFDRPYIFINIYEGICNIFYWFPIIWKDRNYDQFYIYQILKHKLKTQSKYIKGRDWHIKAQSDARNMMVCVKLIDKLQEGYYSGEYFDYHKSNFFSIPIENSTNSELKIEEVWEKYDDYFKKYPLVYKKVMNGAGPFSTEGREDDKHIIAMNIGHYNENRARKLLFSIMENNIESWWD